MMIIDENHGDKQWAQKYLLDPLTAPEPSQETGVGSSHVNQLQVQRLSLSPSAAGKQKQQNTNPLQNTSNDKVRHRPHQLHHNYNHRQVVYSNNNSPSSTPTPPASASPNTPSSITSSFHPSNPYSDTHRLSSPVSPPNPASSSDSRRRYLSGNSAAVNRSASARVANSSSSSSSSRHHRVQLSLQLQPDSRHQQHHRSASDGHHAQHKHQSPPSPPLFQRFPGDMSHRPLEILKKDHRAADRAPHLRKKSIPVTDIIDALDTIGGTYHHGGPYDATLASRNRNQKYSPVAAVQESNLEAIRATPSEYMADSLNKHMPLQGTATIPSGETDMSGRRISYEEGADLMREPDAAGGAYKRYDGIQYLPDDLKGKGEPSYTYEKDLKERKRLRNGEPAEYEMQSGVNGRRRPPVTHHRSFSNEHPEPSPTAADGFTNSTDLRRNNTTGKRLSDGLKRRFGSIRRKKSDEAQ
ncbi:hypothetical protein G7046_g5146 [Stylonectria norvegica]|nr:hypothetical protein G7046_g5146 [Stylonectria norvegica]